MGKQADYTKAQQRRNDTIRDIVFELMIADRKWRTLTRIRNLIGKSSESSIQTRIREINRWPQYKALSEIRYPERREPEYRLVPFDGYKPPVIKTTPRKTVERMLQYKSTIARKRFWRLKRKVYEHVVS